jgi:hypothetical protein
MPGVVGAKMAPTESELNMDRFVMAIVTAAVVAAGAVAVPSSADARYYRHFQGAYAYAPHVRMYAAGRYQRRPLIPGTRIRVNNNYNPDFQLGGGYGQ